MTVSCFRCNTTLLPLIAVMALAAAPLVGCQAADETGTFGEHAEGAAAEHAEGAEGEHAEGAEAEGEHVHQPESDEIPSREAELERDEYSKPNEVFAFFGIAEGWNVVDIGAGSGYNTFLLSGIVASDGHVWAAGGNDGLRARMERGDLAEAGNITIPGAFSEIPDASVDAVVMIREYHLRSDYLGFLADVDRVLKPGGIVGVVEVRNNQTHGHDPVTHRLGEETLIEQFGEGGFEFVDSSDILRRDDDDYSEYWGAHGSRYITDRMLMTFRKAR